MNDAVLEALQGIWQRIETQLLIEAEFAHMSAFEAMKDFRLERLRRRFRQPKQR